MTTPAPLSSPAPAEAEADTSNFGAPPSAVVGSPETAPTPVIDPDALRVLGQQLSSTFDQYKSDRRLAELKWTRNLRQYLGIYDPEIEAQIGKSRSKAYPKITRVKCISVLSRVMDLMFPGDDKNWTLKASPSADMSPQDVMQAVQEMMARYQQDGLQAQLNDDTVQMAVQELATRRAKQLETVIDDQLQELGGDQTVDYVHLNRKALASGILFGLGLLRGPYVKAVKTTRWSLVPSVDPLTGQPGPAQPVPQEVTSYKPLFEFLPVWDFFPDMSAKTLSTMDGYFVRLVMTKAQVRKLADRPDFFASEVKKYLTNNATGNYRPQQFETELRTMGVREMVNDVRPDNNKYEVLVWNGTLDGSKLRGVGIDVPPDKIADDIDAEVWMIGGTIIKAAMNPWRKLGVDVRTIHPFVFDEDDTGPLGNGLPNVMRDSQMSVSAAVRMLLDNGGVVCGPNLELNRALLEPGQDLSSTHAYKMWYRDDDGPSAQFPAVRNIQIDGHLAELSQIIEMFLKFADTETFVGPATGGDMEQTPSEPMRTAAGASMMRGNAALPFKDIIRSFDSFTQSIIQSLVQFNRTFNPDQAAAGDYNVIARGATSLIAKEVRGMMLDNLAVTLTPREEPYISKEKFARARLAARDLDDIMATPEEAQRNIQASSQQAQKQEDLQTAALQAETRKTLADAYKAVTQGQKNSAASDAQSVQAALAVLDHNSPESDSGNGQGAKKAAGK